MRPVAAALAGSGVSTTTGTDPAPESAGIWPPAKMNFSQRSPWQNGSGSDASPRTSSGARSIHRPPRTAHGIRIHRDKKSGRDETRQRHHGQCRQDIGTQGTCEQIAHLPLPAPGSGDVEHDQLGEIGEIRSHPLEPFPDASDDGNNLRSGIARVRDMRE